MRLSSWNGLPRDTEQVLTSRRKVFLDFSVHPLPVYSNTIFKIYSQELRENYLHQNTSEPGGKDNMAPSTTY
jgi:hypothetical protein